MKSSFTSITTKLIEKYKTPSNKKDKFETKSTNINILLNRVRFGSESVLLAPFVYGVGQSAKALAKRGKELAYSSSRLDRALDKLASIFRFRGTKPL